MIYWKIILTAYILGLLLTFLVDTVDSFDSVGDFLKFWLGSATLTGFGLCSLIAIWGTT